MTLDQLCERLQGKIESLQEVVDDTRTGEHDYESLWREFDRICQEIAYLSEAIVDEDDDDDSDAAEEDGDELDFEDEDEGDVDEDFVEED